MTPLRQVGAALAVALLAVVSAASLQAQDLEVVDFALIDADTDQLIRWLNPTDEIYLDGLPTTNLNIYATTIGDVGSVRFAFAGDFNYRTENVVPYALGGDTNGDYNAVPELSQPGAYTITATPYTGGNGTGTAGGARTLQLTVVGGLGGGSGEGGGSEGDPGGGSGGGTQEDTGAFQEEGGLVVIEMESGGTSGAWASRSDFAGATGGQYLIWEGSQSFNTPGNGLITFPIAIAQPGIYRFQWRTAFGSGTSPTEHNDTWLKIEADAFYGQRGSSTVCPKGYDPARNDCQGRAPNGAGADGWFKVYRSGGSRGQWSWLTRTSDNDAHDLFARFDAPGTYRILVSARSSYHAIDRLVLAWEGYAGDPTTLSLPESPRDGSTGGGSGGGPVAGCTDGTGAFTIEGAQASDGAYKRWHPVTVTFEGPCGSENGAPNPFLDRRLEAVFAGPGGQEVRALGYFAADGNAAETSATEGNKWRVHFNPPAEGAWTMRTEYWSGPQVAVANNPTGRGGVLDGLSAQLRVGPSDACAGAESCRDHRGKGLLRYVGERYLRYDNGEYFVKGGADSPENLLAYADFDGTYDTNGTAKTWAAHERDWRPGDPTWQGQKGKGLIGALNYLAEEGMNAFSFLPFNAPQGDGKDVWPWLEPSDPLRYDVSKLAQWEIVFTHADQLGHFLHFKTQETENDQYLDGGDLGTERRLYYRELVARFGHHHALNWNLGEENTNTTAQRKAFADYLTDLDPYDHPIVVHTYPGQQEQIYGALMGDPSMTGASIQLSNVTSGHEITLEWLERSEAAGRPWHVAIDEPGNAGTGVSCDGGGNNHGDARRNPLWGNLMAGGTGVEWYFGYQTCAGDLSAEDWRTRDRLWDYTRHALTFFREYLPFWEMANANNLTADNDDYVLAKPGEVYAVYVPDGDTPRLDLPGGTYAVQWFDPRNGGALRTGPTVEGGGTRDLGAPPSGEDWVALVTNGDLPDDEPEEPGEEPEEPPTEPPASEVVFAVNAGGGAYTDAEGVTYAADGGASGGRTYTNDDPIAGTDDDALYQSERYGDFAYAIPVPTGTYDVVLRFAEIYWSNPGRRVFDVTAEGQQIVADLDLYERVGANTAYDVSSRLNVSDGTLDLSFVTKQNNAKVSAILVRTAESSDEAVVWQESFDDLSAGATSDDGPTAWTASDTPSGSFGIRNGQFEATNTDGEGVWRSAPIDIAGRAVDLALMISSEGAMETSGSVADHLRVSYQLDGGSEVVIADERGNFNGDVPQVVRASGLLGSTLVVVVRALTTANTETYAWDDVTVSTALARVPRALSEAAEALPTRVYPNPVTTTATFEYDLAARGPVRLEVFDLLGRRVLVLASGEHEAGSHQATFRSAGLAAGVYHWRLHTEDRTEMGQITVTR